MTGLVLKLGPRERVLINGAVIENGERRSRVNILTPGANILRLRDAIHPDEATTPVRRVCYTAQLVLSGDLEPEATQVSLLASVEHLMTVFARTEGQEHLRAAAGAIREGRFYVALKFLRALLPIEERLLTLRAQA